MSADAYRGTVDPLGAHRRRFGYRFRWRYALGGLAITTAAIGGSIVAGTADLLMPAGIGLGVTFDEVIGRQRRRGVVHLHEHGVRVQVGGDATVPWVTITAVEVHYTSGRWRILRGLALVTDNGQRHQVPDYLADLAALERAIEAAVLPRLHASAEAHLDGGGTIGFGRYHLDAVGLHARDQVVPWAQLGPVRYDQPQFVLMSAIGPFELPIGLVSNPAVLAAVVAARGRKS